MEPFACLRHNQVLHWRQNAGKPSGDLCSLYVSMTWTCMQVNVAGTSQQMSDALEEAEEFREPLVERGFMVIPLPIFEESDAQKDKQNQLKDTDLRYVRHSLLVDMLHTRECLFLLPISVAQDREASTHGIGTQSSTPGFCVWRIRQTSLRRL